jgi:hypothetical protein
MNLLGQFHPSASDANHHHLTPQDTAKAQFRSAFSSDPITARSIFVFISQGHTDGNDRNMDLKISTGLTEQYYRCLTLNPFTISPTATSSLFAGSGTYVSADFFAPGVEYREEGVRV